MKSDQLAELKKLAKQTVINYGVKSFVGDITTSNYNIPVKLKNAQLLLFNSNSRALIKLTQAEYASLQQIGNAQELEEISKKQLSFYLSNQFLVGAKRNELFELEQKYKLIRANTESLNLTIAPTFDCNLACGYCFQGLDKGKKKIDDEVSKAIVEHVKSQIGTLKHLNVTWYGGEPLMAKPGLLKLSDQLIAVCSEHNIGYSASIVTNGYLLDVRTAQELFDRKVTWAQLTVDGMAETHDKMRPKANGTGSFDKIFSNIKEVIAKTPLSIHIRINVGEDNLEQCEALLHFLEDEKLAYSNQFQVYFAPIDASTAESGSAFQQSLNKKVFNQRINILTRLGQKLGMIQPTSAPKSFLGMCVAVQNNGLVIAANGELHRCWETMHDTSKSMGTIFDLNDAIKSRNNLQWIHWSPFDNPVCNSCKILPLCGGMCGHRYVHFGEGSYESTPCPDWKWNTAENIFNRALQAGVVTEEEWLVTESTIDTKISGERHSSSTLAEAQTILNTKLSNLGIHNTSIIYIEAVG